MKKKEFNKSIPRYQQIAIEIATRIASGEYQVGEKIYARSTLASQHGVSAETARRAICVLSDLDVVVSSKGSGVTIKSFESAKRFLQQQDKRKTIDQLKSGILSCISRQQAEMDSMNGYLTELVAATEHFRSLNPFVPFQTTITKDCTCLNKSISEIRFWQNTSATIIAVRREDVTITSPGPYLQFLEGDTIFFITQGTLPDSVIQFLYPES